MEVSHKLGIEKMHTPTPRLCPTYNALPRTIKTAGKTTTIGMLTGAISPTEGTAKIVGKDIRRDMNEIRGDIGICLQHDCLFPKLTVREHIQFFSRLKGMYDSVSYAEAEASVDQAIRDVALGEKSHTFSTNLSGGMKRKLSLAMAFCGGSKVV
jgi:ABC-type multidrug transport system ATPase subunit